MKKLTIWALLLLPLAGFCQFRDASSSDTTVELFPMDLKAVMTFLAKDSISQSEVQPDFNALRAILNKDIGDSALIKELNSLDRVKDSVAFYNFITTKPAALYRKKLLLKQEFVENHPDSWMSLYTLEENNDMYSAGTYAVAYEKLSDRLKKTHAAQSIRDRITAWKKLAYTGIQAPDFTRKDQNGKTVKLSDYRGKLIILDFWGSWCGACRQSHPHLKELYAEYRNKGLEIIAVANENVHGEKTALNKARAAWLAAIKKDDVNWVHVLNDEGTGAADIVKAYNVGSYPTKFLLDKNGKILLRIDGLLNIEIDKTIKAILDNNGQ
jgi:thiol-disulfide isomerase/thioredoxin